MTKLPTREECFRLLDKYGTSEKEFEKIKDHSIIVAKIAVFLAKELNKAGEKVNVELIEKAGLLHDIAKAESIKSEHKISHRDEAYKILLAEGYPEIAELAKKHGVLNISESKIWEEKLIVYSDIRTVDRQVSKKLEDKFKLGIERYKKFRPDIEKTVAEILPKARKLEKEIFSKLKIKPEDLGKYVK